jgi:endonuclease/exonuclease/phosphatase (EEP) superfamily protein YafD
VEWSIGEWAAALFAAGAAALTALPLLRSEAWWIRALDFPRAQIALLTLVALSIYLWINGLDDGWDYAWVAALVGCLLYQGARIVPYTPFYPKQAKDAGDADPERCLRLLTANVLTPNRNAAALLDIIAGKDPDIVLCVETDLWWEQRLQPLEERFPYVVKHPRDNLYGMHLYCKLPLIDPKVEFLVESDIPSIRAEVELRNGRRVRIHCVHPTPPSPTENPSSKERDAELVLVGKAVAAAGGPAVVFGDLNDVAWSDTTRLFQKISKLLDPRIGRGMFNTFHAQHVLVRWPLDHVFFSSDFTVLSVERLGFFGSDHFPIFVALCHTPAAEAVQEAPRADSEDRAEAERKLEQVDALPDGQRVLAEREGNDVTGAPKAAT